MSILLFCYGTLKSGFLRNSALQNQKYLGVARTVPKYGMYRTSGFPALVDKNLAEVSGVHAENRIYGELYEVEDSCLAEIDKIEGTSHGVFARHDIDLEEITLSSLPVTEFVWNSIARKKAHAYFYKQKLNGAADCGQIWVQRQ